MAKSKDKRRARVPAYKTIGDAIAAAIEARGVSLNTIRVRLGKTSSFYETLRSSPGVALADDVFDVLGIRLVVIAGRRSNKCKT